MIIFIFLKCVSFLSEHKAMTVAYNQMIVENSDISETLVKVNIFKLQICFYIL